MILLGCLAGKELAEEAVTVALKSLLSLVVAMLLFEGMVTAFHLLNLPSDLAVLEGIGLLLATAVAAGLAFRGIWMRRSD